MGSIVYKNIFDAVTDSPEASSELQTRSDLMIVIRDIINEQSWTQAEAAKELGLTQPRISDLKKGKLEKFSIDLLMTCLFRIGFRFKPEYKNHTLKMTVQAVN
ncbi:Helix-turn-helix motif [hydrothermal vent metagenome]|uniref:Helix-turn-helix motif n=1 Tax=hydrothermal vent metagenome TaxID=652676 RepID=A0A3B0XRL0_9ZZZZ